MATRSTASTASSKQATETIQDPARAADALDIGDLLRQITLRQHVFEKRVSAALNADVAGLEVLSHLMSSGPATPTQLAKHLGASTATTTLVLNRLEAAGHITRERHTSDGRKLLVRIVKPSAARAARLVKPLIEQVDARVSELAPKERHLLERFLTEVVGCYDSLLERQP